MRMWMEHSRGLWNPATTVASAYISTTLVASKVCKRWALITTAPASAASLSAVPPPATSSISMVGPTQCGSGKRLLHWNGELLDWWLVLLVWRGGGYVGVQHCSHLVHERSLIGTDSGMVTVMVLPVVNAAMFVVAVAVVSVLSWSLNTL